MTNVAMLLHEANFDPWESLTSALSRAAGLVPPRVAWLTEHVATTKRTYWTLVAQATRLPAPPPDLDLDGLLSWEVEAAGRLTPEHLATRVTYGGREFTVEGLLRLNARHTAWHAGQIAALCRVRQA